MARPKSLMPMFIVGGKGSGKTHLMRHFAFELQKIASQSLREFVSSEGYLGVYVRGSGLNASRFSA